MVEAWDLIVRKDLRKEFETYHTKRKRNLELGIKNKKWAHYQEARNSPTMSIDELVNKIQRISKINNTHAALFVVLYCCGMRIGELLGSKFRGKPMLTYKKKNPNFGRPNEPLMIDHVIPNPRFGLIYHPLLLKNIFITSENTALGFKFLKEKGTTKESRVAYVSLAEHSSTYPLIEILEVYLKYKFPYWSEMLEKGLKMHQLIFEDQQRVQKELDSPVFDFSINWAWCLCNQYFNFSLHNFRALRANHLSGFMSEAKLRQFFGWKSYSMVMKYSESRHEKDLLADLVDI
jgi:hypothetical protein